jgi:large subunit ribosomal protein L32e
MKTAKLIKKKKRFRFIRQRTPGKRRLNMSWRRPKGIDSPKRIERKEKGRVVKIGYRTPKAIRYLHPSGMEEVLVYNPSELDGMKDVVIRIASTVGKRKRKEIVKKAEEMGLKVINP